ncbi:hypothetical protein ACFFQW_06045 [Umezawaea endophytica]|uniref:Uncharacterized protein n=1 Tax=Umezawaea endophytica TaxID=1654476 RepID=A0A9X3AHJ6_9PSEU|nr:hypothetical protein [Umezawaea endophytica]MCS7481111.1 hypothetical protein [Umezawaea endophytica]
MTVMEPNAAYAGQDLSFDQQVGADEAGRDLYHQITTADPSGPLSPAGLDERPPEPHLTADEVLQRIESRTLEPEAASIPIPLPTRAASGRYRSPALGFQLELRVDVDGRRPLRKLSGDYFSVSGATTTYFGSWTVDAVTITTTPTLVTIIGTARTTWTTTYTVARVTIPRVTVFQPAPPATIRWSTPTGTPGATYACSWESGAFRTVELEQDTEAGVTAFASYNTGSLPSGGPARTLSTAGAYAEAGVQMVDTGAGNVITTSSSHIWTNASLHNAMVAHFSRYQERSQFKVWLLHAMRHELGVGLRGIMFDQQGLQRQGCASFYQAISAGTAANLREQLYVNTHELGHCFNLFHSFHKTFMTPPLPNRPGSLSWMNYPQNYAPGGGAPGGAAAFWGAFPFQFDDLELAHVRHGFRNNVIMGGNPFGTGAALEAEDGFADPVLDTSGLELRIAVTPDRPVLGTPVVLEIKLVVERTQQVHRREQLHPKYRFVQVAISRPRGDVVVHQPPVSHCAVPDLVLDGHGESQPISAYIGYDATVGQIFEDPGTYRIRASYVAPDGSLIVSNATSVRIAAPRTEQSEQVADLLLTDQAGMALTLLGSDSRYLAEGTRALETVASDYGDHPAALYAKLALGINAARPYTEVLENGEVRTRERDLGRGENLLRQVVDASRGDEGVDNLTVYQALAYLSDAYRGEGDENRAQALKEDARQLAESKNEPVSVLRSLE